MSNTILLTDQEISTPSIETPASVPGSATLRHHVREFLRQYFMQLANPPATNVYELILAEVEAPMLEIVLRYTGQNQSRAAHILSISRGTLRKKMSQYGLLPSNDRKKKAA